MATPDSDGLLRFHVQPGTKKLLKAIAAMTGMTLQDTLAPLIEKWAARKATKLGLPNPNPNPTNESTNTEGENATP